MKSGQLLAGAAVADITPAGPVFLFGYPNVVRWSSGVSDPLLASALFLSDGKTSVLFIAASLIFIGTAHAREIRNRIAARVPVPAQNILISATHTHSGPATIDYLSNEHDRVVPKADSAYLHLVADRMVDAAVRAFAAAEPARIGLAVANGTGVGTNRRDPLGPADPEVPVLVVSRAQSNTHIAAMLICSMHPTVLHEDWTLISGDFPVFTVQYLQKHALGMDCPVLYHTGPAGNLSPRHVISNHSIPESRRLGEILGHAVASVVPGIPLHDHAKIACDRRMIELPLRTFDSIPNAEAKLAAAVRRLESLRQSRASRAQVRTAECDVFGAQETLTLAIAAAEHPDRVARVAASCMPAEVQLIRIGSWNFAGWPGEVFVEYALQVKARCPNTYLINYANGELQGYLVTAQAVEEGGYEASNAIFRSPESAELLVEATIDLLNRGAGSPESCR
jgi:hypothetical protein